MLGVDGIWPPIDEVMDDDEVGSASIGLGPVGRSRSTKVNRGRSRPMSAPTAGNLLSGWMSGDGGMHGYASMTWEFDLARLAFMRCSSSCQNGSGSR